MRHNGLLLLLVGVLGFMIFFDVMFKDNKPIRTIKPAPQKIIQQTKKEKQEKIVREHNIIIISTFIYENNTRVDKLSAIEYSTFIYDTCRNKELVVAIITNESNFRPTCRSKIGALGLGQIRPEMWLRELHKAFPKIFNEPKDLYNWRKNIVAIDYIISKLMVKFNGNVEKTLKYYVGGNYQCYIKSVMKMAKELDV